MLFQMLITQSGLKAALAAISVGTQAQIEYVLIGEHHHEPTGDEIAVTQPVQQLLVSDAQAVSDSQLHLTAVDNSDKAYEVNEIGLFLSDDTLFAIWSDPVETLTFKNAGIELFLAIDLVLTGIQTDQVAVIIQDTVITPSLPPAEPSLPASPTQAGVVRLGVDVAGFHTTGQPWTVNPSLTQSDPAAGQFMSLDDALDYADRVVHIDHEPILIELGAGTFPLRRSRGPMHNRVRVRGVLNNGWPNNNNWSGTASVNRQVLLSQYPTRIELTETVTFWGQMPEFWGVFFQNPVPRSAKVLILRDIQQEQSLMNVGFEGIQLEYYNSRASLQQVLFVSDSLSGRIVIHRSDVGLVGIASRPCFFVGLSQTMYSSESDVSLRYVNFIHNQGGPVIRADYHSRILMYGTSAFINMTQRVIEAKQGSQVTILNIGFNQTVSPSVGTETPTGARIRIGTT